MENIEKRKEICLHQHLFEMFFECIESNRRGRKKPNEYNFFYGNCVQIQLKNSLFNDMRSI